MPIKKSKRREEEERAEAERKAIERFLLSQ
jgi:hypothetical protein